MSEDKKVEGRTAYIEKNMPEGMVKKAVMGISKMADKVGFTQEKEYKGKSTEELSKKGPEKKRAGGVVGSASKRADGCAIKGKTRGRMV